MQSFLNIALNFRLLKNVPFHNMYYQAVSSQHNLFPVKNPVGGSNNYLKFLDKWSSVKQSVLLDDRGWGCRIAATLQSGKKHEIFVIVFSNICKVIYY